jgi:hypothetical protein
MRRSRHVGFFSRQFRQAREAIWTEPRAPMPRTIAADTLSAHTMTNCLPAHVGDDTVQK